MRHIHSDKRPKFIPSMVCRSEKRLLIVTGKIKRTFLFEGLIEGPLNQIKKANQEVFLLSNYGEMWYTESKIIS